MTTNMEDYVKDKLQTKTLKRFGTCCGGCINQGYGYKTDKGSVFIKTNSKLNADIMFSGEFYGLKEMYDTRTVKVPKPIVTGKVDSASFIVMEYCQIKPIHKYSSQLGRDLAKLHASNLKQLENRVGNDDSNLVNEFGFHVTTCCGFLPQNNEWCKDWVLFFTSQRLLPQIKMIERDKNCRQISELWSQLQLKIPSFFKDLDVKPSLLHGDLWSGNAGETDKNPLIFDPATFYGHHEYDLGIAGMFGGFDRDFYDAYHELIPKAHGFEKRNILYQLYHHLNHWNHFGSGYKASTLSIMRNLIS